MTTIGRARDKAEIIRRLKTVRPLSTARWGRMSAHQMICHVGDALRMATGDRAVTPARTPAQTVVRWMALYAPLSWRAGIMTSPELDQECGGTRPTDFARDVAAVEALLERVAAPHAVLCPAHPVFGRMSRKAWLRWAYLHMDHHLRQFGV